MSVEAHISCHPIWPIERRKDHCSFKVKFISIISFTTQINTPACIFNTDSVWFCGTELYKHTSNFQNTEKREIAFALVSSSTKYKPCEISNTVEHVESDTCMEDYWAHRQKGGICYYAPNTRPSSSNRDTQGNAHTNVTKIRAHKVMHTPMLQKSAHTR